MEAPSYQNKDQIEQIQPTIENREKNAGTAGLGVPKRITHRFKLALLCALAIGCGSADRNDQTPSGGEIFRETGDTNLPALNPIPNIANAPRQFFITREEGKEFHDYYLAVIYPGDLRFVLRDINNEQNYSFVDTKGRTDDLDTVYSSMPAPSVKGVTISAYDKASCEPETVNCSKEIPVKKILKPGEEGIQGPSEALVY